MSDAAGDCEFSGRNPAAAGTSGVVVDVSGFAFGVGVAPTTGDGVGAGVATTAGEVSIFG